MNALDRAKSYISPSLGVKIAENRAREKAFSAYEGANPNPSTRQARGQSRGIFADKGESKALNNWDRQNLTREISDLYRNDGGLLSTIVDRLSDHVVGDGIFPQARTHDESWNDAAEEYLRNWSNRSDFEQREGFGFIGQGQRLLIADAHFRGGSFIRTLGDMHIQWLEYEMCRNPMNAPVGQWDDGVKLDAQGRVIGYNFATWSDGKQADIEARARSLIHMHTPFFRARQRKGIPVMANMVPRMQQIVSTTEAMQLKVLLEAQQTIKFTGKGPGGQVLNDAPLGSSITDAKGREFTPIETDKGTWYDLPEDRDVGAVESRTPSGEHIPYMNRQEIAVCARAGIPYSIAMMLAGASYSATRGELLVFEATKRRWWNYCVYTSQRLWDWVIADAVMRGFLPPAPTKDTFGIVVSDYKHVEWSKPEKMTLSPLEDQKVFDAAFGRGDMTMTQIAKSKNQELKDVWDESGREISEAITRAKALSDEHGVDVPYTLFLNKQRPGSGNPNAGTTRNKAEEEVEND